MENKLRDIMSGFAGIITELDEIKRVLQLQVKATNEPEDMELKSVLNVQIRLVERALADIYPLFNEIDYMIMDMDDTEKKKENNDNHGITRGANTADGIYTYFAPALLGRSGSRTRHQKRICQPEADIKRSGSLFSRP